VAAEYEVNIKLNTQQVERELKKIESGVKKVGKTEKQTASSTDRRVAAMVKLRSIDNDVAALKAKGLDVSKAQFQVDEASKAINEKMFLTANSRMGVAVKELKVQRGITKQLEQQEKARRRQRMKRAEGVALGAGFPLLFGGGAGSVLGGALGGLTGSFGAQIALSAIGQQIDKFVAGMADAGKALTSVGSAADFMAEKSLFSSDSMQFRIEKLIEEGKVTEAAAEMTQEMAKQVGGAGLKALKDLGSEANKMGKLFGTVMLRIQAFMAQALTPLIKMINNAIGGMVAQNQLDQMLAEAGSPERRAQILARSQELRGSKRQGRAGVTQGDFTMEMLKTLQSEYSAIIPEGAAIVPTELETLRAGATSGRKRKSKLPALEAEREKLESLLRLEEKRFDLELQGDKAAIARLKADEKIVKIFEKIRDIQSAGLTDEERQVALKNASLEIARADLELQFKLADIQQDRIAEFKQSFEDQLQFQDELSQKIKEQESAYKALNDTFRTGIVDSILDAVEGTKSLKDSLLGVIKQMARLILQQQLLNALKGFNLFGGGGGGGVSFEAPDVLTSGIDFSGAFANGGRPAVGKAALVGERGPELFVPDRAGTIVPNNALGGTNIVVNVDASGTQAQGDQPNAKALGAAIGAAVQAELVRQKRPGGLLST
jgi:hypothetical protein